MYNPLKKLVLAATIAAISVGAIQPKPAQAGESVVIGMVATMALVGTTLVAGAAVGARLKPMLAEVAPDAMRFLATDRADKSPLLASFLDETRQEIASRGENADRFSDQQLAEIIVKLALQE